MGRFFFRIYSIMNDFVNDVDLLCMLLNTTILHVFAWHSTLPLVQAILVIDWFDPGFMPTKYSLTAQGRYRLVQSNVIRMIRILLVGLVAFLGLRSAVSGANFALVDIFGDLLLVQAELYVCTNGFRSHVDRHPLIYIIFSSGYHIDLLKRTLR